jgi:primosomal protein N'
MLEVLLALTVNDLKTVNGHICGTFKETCIYLGLLQDDTEWHACLYEASQIKTGQQLRCLFATLLLFCQPTTPELLWNNHKLALCEDILYQNRDLYNSLNHTIEQEALRQLESHLQLNAKSLKDFPNMPLFLGESKIPDSSDSLNQFIREEMLYNNIQLENELSKTLPLLNEDQRAIYNAILKSIDNHTFECFFIDGPGGTGKTFLYNTLLATIILSNYIALALVSCVFCSVVLY